MPLFTRCIGQLKFSFNHSQTIHIFRQYSFTVSKQIDRYNGKKYIRKLLHTSRLNVLPYQHKNKSTNEQKPLYLFDDKISNGDKNIVNQLDYFISLDFEATCWTERDLGRAEIIEFGAVLINLKSQKIISEFHDYVRPTIDPILSDYCVNLTGITQEFIDEKESFPIVCHRFIDWLGKIRDLYQLKYAVPNTNDCNTTFCTWTNMDLSHYFRTECERHQIKEKDYLQVWIDAKNVFLKRHPGRWKFAEALKLLGISQVGIAHSAIDDAKTLAKLVLYLFQNDTILFQIRKLSTGNNVVLFQQRNINENLLLIDQSSSKDKPFDYLICLDFEATCWDDGAMGRAEIIEFGAVLINVQNGEIISQFHNYVRPTLNPNLSELCTKLTRITQELIDDKDNFPIVYQRFVRWLQNVRDLNQLNYATPMMRKTQSGCNATFCSWTSWDLGFFMRLECARHQIKHEDYLKSWIDIRKICHRTYFDRYTLKEALSFMNISQIGTAHSAIDDARTLAQMVSTLRQRNVPLCKVTDSRNESFEAIPR